MEGPERREEHAVAVTDPPLERPAPPKPRKLSPAGPRRGSAGYWGRRVFGLIALLVILAAAVRDQQPRSSRSTAPAAARWRS
jgi:hypothetical protein